MSVEVALTEPLQIAGMSRNDIKTRLHALLDSSRFRRTTSRATRMNSPAAKSSASASPGRWLSSRSF